MTSTSDIEWPTILVSPCGANGMHGGDDNIALGYDCCIGQFGAGQYSYCPGSRNLFSNGYSNGIPMSADEPLHNIDLVDEFGNLLEFFLHAGIITRQ